MKSIDEVFDSITNKKMLVVFPHPDDESVMAGGLIQRAMKKGFEVTVLTLTEGGRGQIHISGKGRTVSEIRRQEIALAMSRLGVTDWIMWKFDDGKLKQTQKWRENIANFIQDTKPGVIVTYDFSGVSGHPDHISLSLVIRKVLKKVKRVRLIWVSFGGKMRLKVTEPSVEKYLQEPEYLLKLSFKESLKKWGAVFAHKSQKLEGFLGYPWWYLIFKGREEWYSESKQGVRYKYRFVRFKI